MLYAIFSTFGFLLNITIVVVIVFLMPRLLNNVTNIFVLTLAFSDIFMCAFNMPIQVFYEKEQSNWSGPLCRVLFASFGLPMYISSLTILLIAIDRYRMIIFPLAPRITRSSAISLVIVVIGLSIIGAIPVAVYSQSSTPSNVSPDLINSTNYQYCVELWPNSTLRLLYSVWTFSAQFLLPLIITAILYLQIYVRLRRRMVLKKDDDKKKRTNRILMSIVICFAICWTPFAVYSLLAEIGVFLNQSPSGLQENKDFIINNCYSSVTRTRQKIIPQKHVKVIDLLLKVFAMGSACINPFLYGWLNESIRDSIKNITGRFKENAHTSYALAPTTRSARVEASSQFPSHLNNNGNKGETTPDQHSPGFLLEDGRQGADTLSVGEEITLNCFTEPPPPYEMLPNIIVHSPKASPSDECLDKNGVDQGTRREI